MPRREADKPEPTSSRWPHRTAWVLVCATFPLIWMGGLVTSYSAGMAVVDWPGTYDHFFWYPLKHWLPNVNWDVFLEHSHRLIARGVGLISIVLAVLLWSMVRRPWSRWLAIAVVVGVVSQGVLGGLRVLANEVLLAKIHGCTGPLFFALGAAVVVVTSRAWWEQRRQGVRDAGRLLRWLAVGTTAAVYLQIILGAQLRHVPAATAPGWWLLWVWLHVIVAGLAAVEVFWLAALVVRRMAGQPMLVRRACALAGLFGLQLALGAAAWVTNYGWPNWFRDYVWPLEYTVVAEGPLQALLTTAHVAVGSLTLVAALSLTMWLFRPPGRSDARDWLATAATYWRLCRPRIVGLVLVTMLAAALVAGERVPPWYVLLHAMVGTGLVVIGAIALNQRAERSANAQMARTAGRPLPSGHLSERGAFVFGTVATLAGLAYLALLVSPVVVLAAAVSWVLYVWVYTPLKLRSAWQTPVGAFAGAMPVLLGAAAAGAPLSPTALALFGVLYLWQFPHAMAIAWLYRDQFARAGIKLATVTDSSGRTAKRAAALGAILLLPVSLVPAWTGPGGWGYLICAVMFGVGYLLLTVRFIRRADDRSARWLLRFSFVYLPGVLVGLVAASL
ncbi:MAG: heme o synthase [Planctomycetota bacterium]|jgi:protoheme IX farnesyltransferase